VELEPAPPIGIDRYMYGHFVIATWSRDALMHGAVDLVRQPLRELASFDYGPILPVRWMARITTFQETAMRTARAQTLEAAATGIATLAIQCGACHDAERGVPYEGPEILAAPPPTGSLLDRMDIHILAADQMWTGLVVPSDEDWNAGAQALARLPNAFTDEPKTSAAFAERVEAVRRLGTAALDAGSATERADVYARLLVACAGCHPVEGEP
jgi:cytochrome c553